MGNSIKILEKEFNQKIKVIILIYFGILAFSPVLLFLLIGFVNVSNIIGLLVNNILGIFLLILGLYTIYFLYKHREAFQNHRKYWGGSLALGGLILVAGLFILGNSSWDYSHFIWNYDPVSSLYVAPYLMIMHPAAIILSSIVLGTVLLLKNYQSSVTRLFFLSYLTFGGAWILFLVYNLGFHFFTYDIVSLLYLGFYLFFFIGVLLLLHGCRRLITLPNQRFPWWFSLSLGIALVVTIFLSYTELIHYGFFTNWGQQLLYLREHSLIFAVTYSGSLLIPLIYSIYLLSKPPRWITKERRHWINRTQIGLILISLYPLVEAVSGLQILPLFSTPISGFNPAPVKILLLMGSISLIYFSYVIMITGVSEVNKWFFEEIKFRATPEIQKINPNINLAKIWEKIDEIQKEEPLSPKEMTNQKVNEYVIQAKKLITEYA